jgi:hypothetical protein
MLGDVMRHARPARIEASNCKLGCQH